MRSIGMLFVACGLLGACTTQGDLGVSRDRHVLADDADVPDAYAPPDASSPPPACTFTIGYWKNHLDAWPVTSLTINGEVYSQAELLALLQAPSRGDASIILARQLIGVLLNGGANDPSIATALTDAYDWLADNADLDGRLPYGRTSTEEAHAEGTAIADRLAAYNEGVTGPGHCD